MNEDIRESLEMLLELLEGIHEPRQLAITYVVGEISTTVEASNFEASEVPERHTVILDKSLRQDG